jgi:hypothetical protein
MLHRLHRVMHDFHLAIFNHQSRKVLFNADFLRGSGLYSRSSIELNPIQRPLRSKKAAEMLALPRNEATCQEPTRSSALMAFANP